MNTYEIGHIIKKLHDPLDTPARGVRQGACLLTSKKAAKSVIEAMDLPVAGTYFRSMPFQYSLDL